MTNVKLSEILRSNQKQGVDYDLLIIQQKRRISNSIKEIDTFVKHNKINWMSISKIQKFKLKNIQNQTKFEYITKFNWIWNKQFQNIINAKLTTRKKRKNKSDNARYRKRKMQRLEENQRKRAEQMILNKSDYALTEQQKNVLLCGLNFAPTPNWNKQTKLNEQMNFFSHIRRVEWQDVLADENEEINENDTDKLPNKLKIPKSNRPDKELVSDKVHAYRESVSEKLRKIGSSVKKSFHYKNNLSAEERIALKDLCKLTREKKIVICKADKDGKIVVVNFKDYDQIMENQLQSFTRISSINSKNIHKHLTKIKTFAENQMIELHRTGAVDDEMLKYTTGIKFYAHKGYQKIPGPTAKYFSCKNPGYAYPLFKTHKLQPDNLKTISIFDIPVRLLQSAGNITTSKITAFLEHIFQSVSVKFCKSFVNEYCRDSKQYLKDIAYWKTTKKYQNNNILYIVAGDVKALYLSIPKLLVKKALTFVLKRFSQYRLLMLLLKF